MLRTDGQTDGKKEKDYEHDRNKVVNIVKICFG